MRRTPREWRHYSAAAAEGVERIGALLAPGSASRGGPPPLLRGLSDSEVLEILAAGQQRVLYRGTTLFKQGTRHDGIYLIESGRIKVFYTAPSGRELTLAYWHPGNFVGGPDVFDRGAHVWSGIASQNSSVLHVPGAALRQMIGRMPELGVNVIEGLAFKGRCYSGIAQMLGTRSATERLAHVLLHLADLYGVEEERGIVIAAAFTHADIANMIGATRQWVTINLKRYSEGGIVGTHHSSLVLVNPGALREIAGG